jgi:hypothetical protein
VKSVNAGRNHVWMNQAARIEVEVETEFVPAQSAPADRAAERC